MAPLVLLVIDCQNDFIKDRSPYSCHMLGNRLVGRIKKLIEFARKNKIPVVYTQHSINPDKSNAECGEPRDVSACIIGSRGWKIIESLRPKKGESVVWKDKYDAFLNTDLENVLRRLEAKTLILSGVLTNNCVRATAEGAHYRNFKLILMSDCCGATSYLDDKTHEEMHDITLRDLKERIYGAELYTIDELKKFW